MYFCRFHSMTLIKICKHPMVKDYQRQRQREKILRYVRTAGMFPEDDIKEVHQVVSAQDSEGLIEDMKMTAFHKKSTM